MKPSYDNETTRPCLLHFVNNLSEPVEVFWVDHSGNHASYGIVHPHTVYAQATFTTHAWVAKTSSGAVVAEYVGDDAIVTITTNRFEVTPGRDVAHAYGSVQGQPEWGTYAIRADIYGITIWAYDCVRSAAIEQARSILHYMLYDTPPTIKQRMVDGGAALGIIGRNQTTCSLPPHAHLKHAGGCGGRDLDKDTRGLGGNREVPTASVGEENVLMDADDSYSSESILIHEFAHSVMAIGMLDSQVEAVNAAYQAACAACLYDRECYMASNADEYWAEGAQAWFDATLRTDVNSGVNTRVKLKAHDPALAALLAQVFGDGPWRYGHTSAAQFGDTPSGAFQAAVAQAFPYAADQPAAYVAAQQHADAVYGGYGQAPQYSQAPTQNGRPKQKLGAKLRSFIRRR